MGRELNNMGAQLCATTLCCAADDTKSTLIEPQSPSSDTLDHSSYDPPRHSVPSTSDDRDTPNPTRHRLPLRGDRAVSKPAAKKQAESTKPTSHRLPLSADRAARKHAAGATQPSIERRIRQLEQQIYGARHVGGIVLRLAEMEQTVSAHQSSSLTVCERVDGLEQLVLSASMSSRSDWSASSSSETSATADEANKSRLTRWFEQFDPENLGKEEEYLKAYQGRQPALFDALELKYHGSGSGSQPNVPTSATARSLPQYTEQQRGDNQRSQGRSKIKWGSTTGSGDCDLPGATSVINSQCTPESSQMSSSLVQSETTRSDDHVSEVEHQQTTPENTTAPILIPSPPTDSSQPIGQTWPSSTRQAAQPWQQSNLEPTRVSTSTWGSLPNQDFGPLSARSDQNQSKSKGATPLSEIGTPDIEKLVKIRNEKLGNISEGATALDSSTGDLGDDAKSLRERWEEKANNPFAGMWKKVFQK